MDLLATATLAASVSAATAALLAHRSWPGLGARAQRRLTLWLTLGVTLAGLFLLVIAVHTARSNSEWDFLAFWLPARAASRGESFYDPATIRAIELPFRVSPEFERQVVDGGSSYPPMSMLLFAPFGLLPFRLAYVAWFLAQAGALLLALRLLKGLAQKPVRRIDSLLIGILVLTSVPAFINLSNAQTQFLLLLLLTWFLLAEDGPSRGIALALAVLVKPYVAILILPVLRYRQLRTLLGALLTLLVTGAATAVLWGFGIYRDYFERASRFPVELYSEPQNQSWAGLLTRRFLPPGSDPLEHPVFWLGVGVFVSICLWRLLTLTPTLSGPNVSLWLFVLLTGLLIYPATLKHYLIVVTLPLLYLWFHQQRLRIGGRDALIAVLVPTTLMALDRGEHGFWGVLATWIVLALLSGIDRRDFQTSTPPTVPLAPNPIPIEEAT